MRWKLCDIYKTVNGHFLK